MEKSNKLAATMRAEAAASSTLDLASAPTDAAIHALKSAFDPTSQPLHSAEPLRLTLIVGGGKKVRQKYDDRLPLLLADALKSIGYSEDRAASATLDAQGTFKHQHDTDKDLKFLHVFPRIEPPPHASNDDPAAMSPAELIVFADAAAYQLMLSRKTHSFSQRRRALELLRAARERLKAVEERMAALEPVSDADATFYESVDSDALARKIEFTSKVLEDMIAKTQLTAAEQRAVGAQLASKLEALAAQLDEAREAGKEKRIAKLEELVAEVTARRAAVKEAMPVVHKLKFGAEMSSARKRLAELEKLENHKGVLPLETVTKLNAKPKLIADLAAMEEESRGWFSDDVPGASCAT